MDDLAKIYANAGTFDLWLGGDPFLAEHEAYLKAHKAHYQTALMSGDIVKEAGCRNIALQMGVSYKEILEIQEAVLVPPIHFYRYNSIGEVKQVYSFSTVDEAKDFLRENIYIPPSVKKEKKTKKKASIDTSDIASKELRTHWVNEVQQTSKTKAPPTPKVQRQHPNGYSLVHLKKSMVIHYAVPGQKKSLCGKPVDRDVKPDAALDPLYDICDKCLARLK